jgi:hypothetical protein
LGLDTAPGRSRDVRGPFDVIAQATADADLVSVTAVSGVLHALASPTIEAANVGLGRAPLPAR